jgi:hypothetical protein
MISRTQILKYLEDPKVLQLDISAAAKLSSELSKEAKKLENRRIQASNDHKDLIMLKRNLKQSWFTKVI